MIESQTQTRIVSILRRARVLALGTEAELQEAIAALLQAHGIDCQREVILAADSRIDILAHGCGVEVKADGSRSQVARQLQRYAQFAEVESLVLVTTRSQHQSLPAMIGGKPLTVVNIGGGI